MNRSDGRVAVKTTEPSLQRCTYIMPGNEAEEEYRLSTFAKFPHSRINKSLMAYNGFVYVGFKDRCKCYACGVCVESWISSDDPASLTFHLPNCEMATKNFVTNKPRSFNFCQALRNCRDSTCNSAHNRILRSGVAVRRQNNVSLMAPAWVPAINISYTGSGGIGSETQFPCINPRNPAMRNLQDRLASFLGSWPDNILQASILQLAESGFYYLGISDKAKCFSCGGGLQNWSYFDNPDVEHSKYYPTCEFLLQKRGGSFIQGIVDAFPNIRRPVMRNPSRNAVYSGLNTWSAENEGSRNVQNIIDPKITMKNINQMIAEEMEKSSFVRQAKDLGFSKEKIYLAVKSKMEATNTGFNNLDSLVNQIESSPVTMARPKPPVDNQEDMDVSSCPPSVNEMVRLQNLKNCVVCKVEKRNTVLLPCGHLNLCRGCGEKVSMCPSCGCSISEKIKAFPT